ncbi:MAG: hypothetical protein P1P85_00970 [Patescibacteria group bacterium]|nr:hypothetical protein [Patescibacteria group bacterium]
MEKLLQRQICQNCVIAWNKNKRVMVGALGNIKNCRFCSKSRSCTESNSIDIDEQKINDLVRLAMIKMKVSEEKAREMANYAVQKIRR